MHLNKSNLYASKVSKRKKRYQINQRKKYLDTKCKIHILYIYIYVSKILSTSTPIHTFCYLLFNYLFQILFVLFNMRHYTYSTQIFN